MLKIFLNNEKGRLHRTMKKHKKRLRASPGLESRELHSQDEGWEARFVRTISQIQAWVYVLGSLYLFCSIFLILRFIVYYPAVS